MWLSFPNKRFQNWKARFTKSFINFCWKCCENSWFFLINLFRLHEKSTTRVRAGMKLESVEYNLRNLEKPEAHQNSDLERYFLAYFNNENLLNWINLKFVINKKNYKENTQQQKKICEKKYENFFWRSQ